MIKRSIKNDYLNGKIIKDITTIRKRSTKLIKILRKIFSNVDVFELVKIADTLVGYKKFIKQYPEKIEFIEEKSLETIYYMIVADYKGKLHTNKISYQTLQNIIDPYKLFKSLNNKLVDQKRLVFDFDKEDQKKIADLYLKPYKTNKDQ